MILLKSINMEQNLPVGLQCLCTEIVIRCLFPIDFELKYWFCHFAGESN